MSQLTIFKASAGSGKTFRLVVEYLKLLIVNPYNYKHILAVTFTNKATAEMKQRIIRDLYKLATMADRKLVQLIADETDQNELKISKNAKLSLALILHDYDRFSVSTIDSFFQRVLRSFARESGLYGSYEVELDQNTVLNEACDRLLMSIDTDNDLRIWLNDMAEEQLGEGKNWQIRNKIIELGKELQKEPFQLFMSQQISEKDEREKLKLLKNELVKTKKWFENQVREYGKRGLETMSKFNLNRADFKGGANSFTNYFNYWANFRTDKLEPTKTVLAAVDEVENWSVQKSMKKALINECVSGGLNQTLKEAVQFLEKHSVLYHTANEISKHVYALGVLSSLALKVRETGLEKNSLMLSESDLLLKGIIGNNDAPFLYEKAGTYYRNFMIDEFQDTSVIQWDNFRPLVVNSLAENNQNLVVGDVKQSIYRWRNSNWQLLNKEIKKDLERFGVNDITLVSNWRSSKNVVGFNNNFFDRARLVLQNDFNTELAGGNLNPELLNEYSTTIENVFSDVVQKPSSGIENGIVQCHFIENKEKEEYYSETLIRLINTIEDVQEKGFGAGDIAILVVKNKQGKMVAEAIINHKKTKGNPKYNYEVISDDSLYIQSSPAVRFLVGILRYLVSPFDEVTKAAIIYEYSVNLLPTILAAGFQPQRVVYEGQQNFVFDSSETESSAIFRNEIVADYFPFFNDKNKKNISNQWINRPLIDLINDLENKYMLQVLSGEQANIQSFKDVISDFTIRESGSIHKFLEWWMLYGDKVKLQTANQRNAIRIMTIHKSKGLEFPIVLLPFCDWSMVPNANRSNILWCSTEKCQFHQFPVLPLNFSSALRKTQFAEAYFTELLLSFIDNFNLLYVALTRAVYGLYVFSEIPSNANSKTIGNLLSRLISDDTDHNALLQPKDENVFETGVLVHKQTDDLKPSSEVDLSGKVNTHRKIGDTLRLRENYEDFLSESVSTRKTSINEGKIMHDLLSLINLKEDIKMSIDRMIWEGKIELANKEVLENQLMELFGNINAATWFDGTLKVLNETTILSPFEGLSRPDRVMIGEGKVVVVDYKTTSAIQLYHQQQVRKYVGKIKSMGYENVEGWVWYLKTNRLINIEEKFQ